MSLIADDIMTWGPKRGCRQNSTLFRQVFAAYAQTFFVAFLLTLGMGPPQDAQAQNPNGLSADITVNGDVSATAKSGGRASVVIGGSPTGGKGRTSAHVGGDVIINADDGRASTTIGDLTISGSTTVNGNSVNNNGQQRIVGSTTIDGNVVTNKGARLNMGACGSTVVSGDVIIEKGSLEIGCGCAGIRDGKCCILFHRSKCVLHQVPPGKHGCPPRYLLHDGLCRLYSDFDMTYEK